MCECMQECVHTYILVCVCVLLKLEERWEEMNGYTG